MVPPQVVAIIQKRKRHRVRQEPMRGLWAVAIFLQRKRRSRRVAKVTNGAPMVRLRRRWLPASP